ncbi:MAG: putative peptidoglycan glycosyltransferase FtsW [Candidatus Paceibacterota bacterium]
MAPRKRTFDRPFFIATIILVVFGFFIFISASLGLLARETVTFSDVVLKQFLFGLVGGTGLMFIVSHIHYRTWRSYAFYIFLASIILTLLVFVPQISFEHGGARRWLAFGPITLQPSEILKIGFVIYFAAWLSGVRRHIQTYSYGLLPFLILLTITGTIVLGQRDTDTFAMIALAGLAMYMVAGGRWRDIGIVILAGASAAAVLVMSRPYIMSRVLTFLDPTQDPLGASYQIRQSLIAIGSGGVFGRGFGQSIQKFEFLPEPIGDSIFAVAAEEFGFIGSFLIIGLFIFFAYRGLYIAVRAPDLFARLLVVGIVILIVIQSFMNIAAMLGLIPLSGMPLLFVSHGGTALLITLVEVGIILNVSKYMTSKPAQT